eukprot:snap_masked-scaffold_22-processed-gene-1.1-mRNA-1 protein AED:1.00 eAED:1.00 QI:0/0/0/0/1/1/2/0/189
MKIEFFSTATLFVFSQAADYQDSFQQTLLSKRELQQDEESFELEVCPAEMVDECANTYVEAENNIVNSLSEDERNTYLLFKDHLTGYEYTAGFDFTNQLNEAFGPGFFCQEEFVNAFPRIPLCGGVCHKESCELGKTNMNNTLFGLYQVYGCEFDFELDMCEIHDDLFAQFAAAEGILFNLSTRVDFKR